jgi:GNAT superfamily N-acetyltransferase
MVSVRVATPGDVPVICQINVQSWQAAFRGLFPDEFLDSLDPKDREPAFAERLTGDPPHHAAVAIDGEVVGFVALGPPDDEDLNANRVLELWGLYVDPDRVGTGTGRILMDHAIDHLRAGGWDYAILWTLRHVDRTRRFYEAAGWYPDGEEKTWEIPKGNAVSLVRYRFDLH